MIVPVNLPADYKIRIGIAAPITQWNTLGGRLQFELTEDIIDPILFGTPQPLWF